MLFTSNSFVKPKQQWLQWILIVKCFAIKVREEQLEFHTNISFPPSTATVAIHSLGWKCCHTAQGCQVQILKKENFKKSQKTKWLIPIPPYFWQTFSKRPNDVAFKGVIWQPCCSWQTPSTTLIFCVSLPLSLFLFQILFH